MKYELFYATGGHGGPYEGKAAALEAARRLVGGANGSYIDVVPYSQPWEATPVRDLHLLRGVERVYAAAALGDWYSEKHETLADKMFAERDALPEGWSPNPDGASRRRRRWPVRREPVGPSRRDARSIRRDRALGNAL